MGKLQAYLKMLMLMSFKTIFYLSFLVIGLTNCLVNTSKSDINKEKEQEFNQLIDSFPIVEVHIQLNDTISYGEEITLKAQLTNNKTVAQQIIFDKPAIPWAIGATVINTGTLKSVLKYDNRGILSSQLYTQQELKDMSSYLEPGQSIQQQFTLADIVVLNTKNTSLKSGTYSIQLFYYSNPSNTTTFTIR